LRPRQHALKVGYRCLDTANDYANEAEIGQALSEVFASGSLKRSDIFIQVAADVAGAPGTPPLHGLLLTPFPRPGCVSAVQSKLWNSNHRPEHVRADLEATLRDLKVKYVDSFVIHWPQACPATGTEPRLIDGSNTPGHKSKGAAG
jgi:diketogulonate reductase-like aldo/keto reductase